MRADEYSHLGQGNIDAAKKVGVWDRLGPITKVRRRRWRRGGAGRGILQHAGTG